MLPLLPAEGVPGGGTGAVVGPLNLPEALAFTPSMRILVTDSRDGFHYKKISKSSNDEEIAEVL